MMVTELIALCVDVLALLASGMALYAAKKAKARATIAQGIAQHANTAIDAHLATDIYPLQSTEVKQ